MRRVRRTLFPIVVVLALACDRSRDESRYAVEVDLAPTIAQLGAEEQADVDDAVERLAGLGDAAVPALERAVTTEQRPIALAAIEALGQIGTPRSDTALMAVATRQTDGELQATALLRLGEGGRPTARPILEAALVNSSTMVSHTAAIACGTVCASPAAIDRIVDIGLREVPDVDLGRIRVTLVRLLKGTDQTAATRTREAIVTRTAPILAAADAPPDLRTRAALMAADAGVPDLEPVLLAAARDPKNAVLRAAAVQWLGRNGTAAAVPLLQSMLETQTLTQPVALALQAMVARNVPEAKAVIDGLAAAHRAPPPEPQEKK